MKSLQENLKRIRDVLNSTSANGRIGHYYRPENIEPSWVVWQESDEDDSYSTDNIKVEQQIAGTIDCYTKIEYDPLLDEIQVALNDAGIGFRLNSVQYEDETKLIHYEWEFYVA